MDRRNSGGANLKPSFVIPGKEGSMVMIMPLAEVVMKEVFEVVTLWSPFVLDVVVEGLESLMFASGALKKTEASIEVFGSSVEF